MSIIYPNISIRAIGVAVSVTLATVGLTLASSVANAATVKRLPDFTDQQFENLRSRGEFTELFVAEGRIGNNQLTGDRELGINDSKGNPVAEGQLAWGSDQPVNFTLEYTGSQVNYTVAGIPLSSTAFRGSVNQIFIRTRETNTSNIRLDNLVFDNVFLGAEAFSAPGGSDPDRVDYLLISDISEPFTLTGNVVLSWTGTPPTGSNLAYQIKVGTSEPVPEPLTILGSAVALGFGGLLKKEYSKKHKKGKQ